VIPIVPYLAPARIVDLAAATKEEALAEICRAAASSPAVRDAAALAAAVREREAVMSTGIGLGIAVPHAKIPSVHEFLLAVGRSRKGIDFQALDGGPVHLVVLIAGPEEKQSRYLQILAGVTLRLKSADVRRALMDAAGPAEVMRVLE
jgi:PTS system nitrogen regulatory IIA component